MKPFVLIIAICFMAVDAKFLFWKKPFGKGKFGLRSRIFSRPLISSIYDIYPMPIFPVAGGFYNGYDYGFGGFGNGMAYGNGINYGFWPGMGFGYGSFGTGLGGLGQYGYGSGYGSQQLSTGGSAYGYGGAATSGSAGFHNVGEHHSHVTSINQVENNESHSAGGAGAASSSAAGGGIQDYYAAGAGAAGSQLGVGQVL